MQNTEDKLNEAWLRLRSTWRGDGADYFAEQCMPRLAEYARTHDTACRELSDIVDMLEQELSKFEAE